MGLHRNHKDRALFFWQQAKHFLNASEQLPKTSSPLTAYYCFLNATKCLLLVKGIHFAHYRGVTGNTHVGRTSLSNESICFEPKVVLAELCRYLGETYKLKHLLYNLPYIHLAYNLTFQPQQELFIPVSSPIFVRKQRSSEIWFCAEISDEKIH